MEFLLLYYKTVGSNAMFWSLKGGYTTNIDDAEVFTAEAAEAQHKSRVSDIPFPKEYVEKFTRNRVDCQLLSKDDANKIESDLFVLVESGTWDGNDVQFMTESGKGSFDFDSAATFSKDGVIKTIRGDYTAYPLNYVKGLVRRTVDAKHFTVKHARKVCPFQVNKEKKNVERYHCQCGAFVSEAKYYSGGICNKCDNFVDGYCG